MAGARGRSGGTRPGAGRPPGSGNPNGRRGVLGVETREERSMYVRVLAAKARAAHRLALRNHKADPQRFAHPGPAPAKDDALAAVQYRVNLLVANAIKGDARAAIHLDERCAGRLKYAVTHEGSEDPNALPIPIAAAVEHSGNIVYDCVIPRPRRDPKASA